MPTLPNQASDSPLPHHSLPSPPPNTTTFPHPSHHSPTSSSPNTTNLTTIPSPSSMTPLYPSSPLFHDFCHALPSNSSNTKFPKPPRVLRSTAAIPRTPSRLSRGASSSPVLLLHVSLSNHTFLPTPVPPTPIPILPSPPISSPYTTRTTPLLYTTLYITSSCPSLSPCPSLLTPHAFSSSLTPSSCV